ncbi:MAG: NepR family anti-sigma factor [Sphingomonas fennica]
MVHQGVGVLASRDDDDQAGGADDGGNVPDGAPPREPRPTRPRDNHVGIALRSAYDEAVREDVPPEFLDLLGKLS